MAEIRYRGSAWGSTNDIIEAVSAQEAIDKAISEWKKVEPGFAFAPLFSAPVTIGHLLVSLERLLCAPPCSVAAAIP